MNINTLHQRFSNDTRTLKIIDWVKSKSKQPLHLTGWKGSQLAFIAHSLAKYDVKIPHIFIANDKEEAAYLHNDLQTLLSKNRTAFFPDSYKKLFEFDRLNRTDVLQRTEVVGKLVKRLGTLPLIVTYPEALFEQVVAPDALQKHLIEINVAHELDVPFMIEILEDYGFKRMDFVFEPGQYSVRGGIVDIYSYGNEFPYRVELFDTEVESIRAFDPTTQRSTQNIKSVAIIPNVNTQFGAASKKSLIEILPEDAILWVKQPQFVLERIEQGLEQVVKYQEVIPELEARAQHEEANILKERAFMTADKMRQIFDKYRRIEWGVSAWSDDVVKVEYKAQAQPMFSKNFEKLIEHFKHNTIHKIQNYLFAENPKQIKRFRAIFEDLYAEVDWQPVEIGIYRGFIDEEMGIGCYTDHQIFERYHRYKTRKGFDKHAALKIKEIRELQPGDYVTHIDHGVGRYAGLMKIDLQGKVQEAVKLIYRDNDMLYVGIQSLHKISKYVGKDDRQPAVHKLGSNSWENTKRKAKAKIKELAFDLIKLYAKRKATQGIAFPPDGYMQNELEASFIYEDTPDQAKATEDVKADMMKAYPMDRLICGDVGFGKTEVAIRGAFKAVIGGKQVAILVPTTILALQHAKTFRERLGDFGVKVDYINRFRTTKQKNEIYKRLKEGDIDILIGTHAILNKRVEFKDLGLLVIDEEQKFGVGSKEKLRTMRVNVDTLTLTATPIPRTLQFSLMAARDLSVINTPPPNRQPIHTEIKMFDIAQITEAIENEVSRNGQVFFIHNRVKDLNDMASLLRREIEGVSIGVAHGQMEAKVLEKTLMDFIEGYYDLLVCTNIIETGLDIPNANTIIINNAHNFGLSDLHQLRGRVGRSNKKAYCYLLAPALSLVNSDARKRLQTIEQYAELGSGFQIAMRDLDIRGAGNLLGGEQSGFIMNMGYETYQKILEEAVMELKKSEYKELFKEELEKDQDFVKDVHVETDDELLIPDTYVTNIAERLNLYQKLDKIDDEKDVKAFADDLKDRFGPLPSAVERLFEALRLRWLGQSLGFERIMLMKGKLRCFFVSEQESPYYESALFKSLLSYIQANSDHRFFLKQTPKYLILVREGMHELAQVRRLLVQMSERVNESLNKPVEN